MRKIAIISDIHGNLPALEAVLLDIEKSYRTDEIYCLGDLVDYAPWNNEVIALLQTKKIPTILGNHDERIGTNGATIPLAKHSATETAARIAAIEYSKKHTTDVNKAYLRELPKQMVLHTAAGDILLVHGSPLNNREYIFENHPEEKLLNWFKEYNVNMICAGHTHYSFVRKMSIDQQELLFINTGSVGRSRENIGAKAVYLQLTIDEEHKIYQPNLKKIDYNVLETIQNIEESEVPSFYASFLRKQLLSRQ